MNPTDSDPKNKTAKAMAWTSILKILGVFVTGLTLGIASQHVGGPARPHFTGGPGQHGRSLHEGGSGSGNFKEHAGEKRGPGFGRNRPEPSSEMKAYGAKVKEVLDPFKAKMEAVLTAEQKEKFAASQDEPRGPRASRAPGFQRGGPRGPEPMMGLVIYKPLLDHMAEHLALNDKQKNQMEKILEERRNAFLKFVDQNTPPAPEGRRHREA